MDGTFVNETLSTTSIVVRVVSLYPPIMNVRAVRTNVGSNLQIFDVTNGSSRVIGTGDLRFTARVIGHLPHLNGTTSTTGGTVSAGTGRSETIAGHRVTLILGVILGPVQSGVFSGNLSALQLYDVNDLPGSTMFYRVKVFNVRGTLVRVRQVTTERLRQAYAYVNVPARYLGVSTVLNRRLGLPVNGLKVPLVMVTGRQAAFVVEHGTEPTVPQLVAPGQTGVGSSSVVFTITQGLQDKGVVTVISLEGRTGVVGARTISKDTRSDIVS